VIPTVGYLLLAAGGMVWLMSMHSNPTMLAAALVLLQLAGIRNAWDIKELGSE
jgi:hypothetical protein